MQISRSRFMTKVFVCVLLLQCLRVCPIVEKAAQAYEGGESVNADDIFAKNDSDYFLPVALTGTAAYLYLRDKDPKAAERFTEAVGVTAALTDVLKRATRLSRPNGDPTGFPSGHASAAFAWATFMAERHPQSKWFYYGAASVVGWSRVELNAHYPYQVIAGALLGHFVAEHYAHKKQSKILDSISLDAFPNSRSSSFDLTARVSLKKWNW
jgi:hypothetical protein